MRWTAARARAATGQGRGLQCQRRRWGGAGPGVGGRSYQMTRSQASHVKNGAHGSHGGHAARPGADVHRRKLRWRPRGGPPAARAGWHAGVRAAAWLPQDGWASEAMQASKAKEPSILLPWRHAHVFVPMCSCVHCLLAYVQSSACLCPWACALSDHSRANTPAGV